MATIKDALKKITTKMGIDKEFDTIAEGINLMNDKLEAANGSDIASALDNYGDARETDE